MRHVTLLGITVLLVLVTCAETLAQQSTWVITPNNKRMSVPLTTVNGRSYISEVALSKMLAGSLDRDTKGASVIATGRGDIKFFRDSFLVQTETANGKAISQLPLPVLLRNNELVLPWKDIRYVLQFAGMFTESVTSRGLQISGQGTDNLERTPSDSQMIITGATKDTESGVEPNDKDSPIVAHATSPLVGAALADTDATNELQEAGILRRGTARDNRTTGGVFGPYGERYTLPEQLRRPGVREVDRSMLPQDEQVSPQQQQARPLREQAPEPFSRGRYVLPRDLQRNLNDTNTNGSSYHIQNAPQSAFIAGFVSMELLEPNVRVTSFAVDTLDGRRVRISIGCNGPLPSGYQKPEIDGTRVVLRIPDVTNSVEMKAEYDGVAVVAEHIRNIQLFRLRFDAQIKDCDYRRNGVDGLEFVVYLEGAPRTNTSLANASKDWALDVIVIDPGHGGKDPGAVSKNGTREKDIALQLSLKLAEEIRKAMPNTKVVLTRDDDTFIPLYRRGQIANENNGKLFISMHLNAVAGSSRTARGFETFILRPGRNDDAAEIARRENASIRFEEDPSKYKELTNEEWIVVEMAQRAFVKFSEKFAEMLQGEVSKKSKLHNRGVKQAGFLVLVGASMPNVLFEAAFLSNSNDEQYITSEQGQRETVQGMLKGILKYAEHYEVELGSN